MDQGSQEITNIHQSISMFISHLQVRTNLELIPIILNSIININTINILKLHSKGKLIVKKTVRNQEEMAIPNLANQNREVVINLLNIIKE